MESDAQLERTKGRDNSDGSVKPGMLNGESFRKAFECGGTGMGLLDLQGHWLAVNPAFCRLIGYEREELLATTFQAVTFPEDLSRSTALYRRLCDDNVEDSYQIEGRYVKKDGCPIWVLLTASLIRDHEGRALHVAAQIHDISQRKDAEAALRKRERELRRAHQQSELFINSVPSILIGLSLQGVITRWNNTAANTFGVAAAEVLGKRLIECGVQWLHPDLPAEIESWLRSDSSRRCDSLGFVKDGEKHFLGLTISRVSFPDDLTAGVLITGTDVTERKVLEDQLRQAQKLEAIGQLAAGIAHEINTPTQYVGDNTNFLNESWSAVAGLLSIATRIRDEAGKGNVPRELLEEFDRHRDAADLEYLETEIPRAIDQSLEGIQRVAKIVRAMKEFSHPGSEEKRAIDINKAIETTITVARNEWKYVSEVETRFDPQLPAIPCHAGELNQVILNLLINAAHAIADVVGDGSRGKGKITVSTRREGEWAEIAIRDTGTGIPENVRSRIFEPFFTTKQVGKGTGQGLALAHAAIVRKHEGKIWFDTEVGKGTTFFVRLPLAVKAQ
jgi:PAS domain S-box-containing protein